MVTKSIPFISLTVEDFDLVTHLNTVPELLNRTYNRPTLDTLANKSILGAVTPMNRKVCTNKKKSPCFTGCIKKHISCMQVITMFS